MVDLATLYWIGWFISILPVGVGLKLVAVGKGPWDGTDKAIGLVLGALASLVWPATLPLFGITGLVIGKPKISTRLKQSLYPNARRERKAEILEARRKANFEQGLKTLAEVERQGRLELQRKQAANRKEHNDWQREFDPPKQVARREITTPAYRDDVLDGEVIRTWGGVPVRTYKDEPEFISAAKALAEARAAAHQAETRKRLSEEVARLTRPMGKQKVAPRRMVTRQTPRVRSVKQENGRTIHYLSNLDDHDIKVIEDWDGEVLNWNELDFDVRFALVEQDSVRRFDGQPISVTHKATNMNSMVYFKHRLR